MSRCMHRGLLCLLASLVLGLGAAGVRADQHRFETDYILCPAHLRVQGPQELRAARGSKAGELRVSWAVPPHLTAASGSPLDQAVLTVIADDGASPVVAQRPPTDTAATLHPVPRGRDLEVAVAWTRQGHVISDIRRVRLRSTQIRTWEREGQEPSRPAVAAQPEVPSLPPVEGFAVKAVTDTSITVQWDEPTPSAEQLAMFRIVACSQPGNDCTAPMEKDKTETEAMLMELRPHTEYQPQIRAVPEPNSGYRDSDPATATATTKLAQVTGLTATPGTKPDTTVDLRWMTPSDTANIANFALQHCTEATCSNSPTTVPTANGGTPASTERSTTVTGLTPNTAYHFRIRAEAADAAQHSPWSNTASATPAEVQLAVVAGLAAVTPGTKPDTTVTLRWTRPDPATGIAQFKIQHCSAASCTGVTPNAAATPASTERSTTVKGLTRNTEYHFRIQAVGAPGYQDSGWSATVSHTTAKTQLAAVVLTVAAPTADADTKMNLSWTVPSASDKTNIKNFRIEHSTATTYDDNLVILPINDVDATSRLVENLTRNTAYYFRIRAVAKANTGYRDSVWSKTVTRTTAKTKVAAPSNFSVSVVTANSITLVWDPPSDKTGIAKYRLEPCGPGAEGECHPFNTASANTATSALLFLTPGSSYTVRIKSVATTAAANSGYADSDWTQLEVTTSSTPG